MTVKMPYGVIEINSTYDAIYFIKNRCNDCQHSNAIWSCSSHQAKLCEKKEQEVIEKIKNDCEKVK